MVKAHKCIHEQLHARSKNKFTAVQTYQKEKRALAQIKHADSHIRIKVDTSALSTDPLTCRHLSQRLKNNVECTQQMILTDQKLHLLTQTILPRATGFLQQALRVRRVQGPLRVRTPFCGFDAGVRVPDSYLRNGVPDADIIVFLTARTIGAFGDSADTIAFSGHCETDQWGRPTAAHFNWAPEHLDTPRGKFELDYLISVAMHELTHALVFSPSLFEGFHSQPATAFLPTPYGGSARALTTPRVVRAARRHFGCDSLQGAMLEDGGGAGTGGSHWEMRIFRDEYMTGSANVGPRFVSELTLAAFSDSGWYQVDSAMADPLSWGSGAGCEFATGPCVGGQWEARAGYLCSEAGKPSCSYDRRAEAYCDLRYYSSPLPESRRYFTYPSLGGYSELFDYCPVYRPYSDGHCSDVDKIDDEPTQQSGSEHCETCRCFEESDAFSDTRTRCLRSRCLNTSALEVRVRGRWLSCPPMGGPARIGANANNADFGLAVPKIVCPPAVEICAYSSETWPRLYSISPSLGPASGGLRVELFGEGFDTLSLPAVLAFGLADGSEIISRNLVFENESYASAELPPFPDLTARTKLDVVLADSLGRTAYMLEAFTVEVGWGPYAVTILIFASIIFVSSFFMPLFLMPARNYISTPKREADTAMV